MNDKPTVVNAVRLEDLKVGDSLWYLLPRDWGTVHSVGSDGIMFRNGMGLEEFIIHIDVHTLGTCMFYGPPTITGPEKPKRKVKRWLWAIKGAMGCHDVVILEARGGEVIACNGSHRFGPFEVEVEE